MRGGSDDHWPCTSILLWIEWKWIKKNTELLSSYLFYFKCRILICVFFFLIRKRWHLFPPEDTPFLYPTRIPYEESSVFSKINVVNPDLEQFPQFQKARRHVVTLSPGQVRGFKTSMTCQKIPLAITSLKSAFLPSLQYRWKWFPFPGALLLEGSFPSCRCHTHISLLLVIER